MRGAINEFPIWGEAALIQTWPFNAHILLNMLSTYIYISCDLAWLWNITKTQDPPRKLAFSPYKKVRETPANQWKTLRKILITFWPENILL